MSLIMRAITSNDEDEISGILPVGSSVVRFVCVDNGFI
jgi:hypothetical protein